ncbi:MAG: hypothetical protein HYZ53_26355 [Planctomycetes bacterium]|nr:hypothetical protein [Planctomycetota bacterium]
MLASVRKLAIAVFVASLVAAGCIPSAGRAPVGLAKIPPREVWEKYGDFLRKNDFAKSYHLLSADSKKRYPYFDYYLMFTQTRFGSLIRHLFVAWTISNVTYSADGKRAIVTFQHDIFPQYEKRFDMLLEGDEWKIRITLSGCLDMPEWDERILFPESFGDELDEKKAGTGEGDAQVAPPKTESQKLREQRRER